MASATDSMPASYVAAGRCGCPVDRGWFREAAGWQRRGSQREKLLSSAVVCQARHRMPIRSATFHDFGPFADAEIRCVEGLNVFIGENSTGKSHAMKAIYAVLETLRGFREGKVKKVSSGLETKLAAVFRPDDDAVLRLVRRRRPRHAARIAVTEVKGAQFVGTISTRGEVEARKPRKPWKPHRSVFLPTREILSIYPGFVSLYGDREISFDETYYDACLALGTPGFKGRRRELAEDLATQLRNALGGRTEFTGDRFYVKFDGDRAPMEAHLVAEGLRKIAMLERLVINGSLVQGGYLFWDEPEANLNPRLTAVVADVLRDLAANGVQVFITTHDYLLTKHLDLLMARKQEPPTRFFLFRRPKRGAPVEVTHAERLMDLEDNPIAQEFVRLYELKLDAEAEDDS
ncbi:MAG TPA: AAA family ATPase [Kofleriaceae bacterium]